MLLFAQLANAQPYPSKPIRIVVPYPAGGGIDLIARAAGNQLAQPYPHIPWTQIIGQRNVIAHGYAVLDYGRLFRTVTDDLPGLIESLERIVSELERGLK